MKENEIPQNPFKNDQGPARPFFGEGTAQPLRVQRSPGRLIGAGPWGPYSFGMNPGYYAPQWPTKAILSLGDAVGCKTYRMKVYDDFMEAWGPTNLVPDYEHLVALGAIDITVMVGGVSNANKWNPFNFTTEWGDEGRLWKGMYTPALLADGTVNPTNTFAVYLKKVIDIYGKYTTCYEIKNEPDFSNSSNAGYMADVNNTGWGINPPQPWELANLRATVPYYVRLLRIAWEVVKKFQPAAKVAVGGIGNQSFLKWILEYTDEPNAGAVTAAFPKKGGEYFDVMSFHTYPQYSTLVKWWDPVSNGVKFLRNSDNYVKAHFWVKQRMQERLAAAGYDGVIKPKKDFICTETGACRTTGGDNEYGNNDLQINYNMKCHIATMIDGQIRQTYWYQTADGKNAATVHWDSFGLYKDLNPTNPPTATMQDQGKAQKTVSTLLRGTQYEAGRIAVPASLGGGAFRRTDGTYVYALWNKIVGDLTEEAPPIDFTLPAGQYKEMQWDGTQKDVTNVVRLGGRPKFFISAGASPTPTPVPPAGKTIKGILYDDKTWELK